LDYTLRLFEWGDGGMPNMILDDGGDATLFVHWACAPRAAT
jgi:adenosylhomocysteinase